MSGILQSLAGSLGLAKDAFFSSVALLLTGTGTNGAQNNTFIDSSANNFTVTRNGNATQGTFTPFTSSAPYNSSTKGGGMYFDGNGDYVSIADNAAFTLSGNNFTVEAWVYWNGGSCFFCGQTDATNSGPGSSFSIAINSNTTVTGRISNGSSMYGATGGSVATNVWTHIAWVRNGSNLFLYINGSQVATTAVIGSNPPDSSSLFSVGRTGDRNLDYFSGYISNFRFVNGTAVYTSNFTPSTSPLTAIANTQVLLLGTNAGIIDNAMLNGIETVGNAQISNAQAKWGSTSISFDGTGDWLVMPNATSQQFGTGNFTVEGWLRLNATGVAYGVISKGTVNTGWSVNITSGNKLQFSYTATQLTGATSLVANTWYYFAVVRNGSGTGNLVIYLNGAADATSAGAVTDNFNQTNVLYVGADRVGGSALNGYIQDARITTGVARYTANFSAPTGPFPLQ